MAERGFAAALANALDDPDVSLAVLVYLDWPGGAVRAWSGVGSKTVDGQTYTGVGTLGSIKKIAEGLEKSDIGLELSLNYLDDALRNQVLANDPVGRDASVYFAAMNVVTGVISDAYEYFPGFIDEVDLEDAGTTGVINVRVASELARLGQSTFYLLTDAHQQHLFPGDRGMEFAARMDEPIQWGRSTVTVTRPPPRHLPPAAPPPNTTPPAPNPRLPDNQPTTEPTVPPRTHPALRP